MSFSASCFAPEGDTGLDPCYPPSLLLNLAEKTPGLKEEQRHASFTRKPEKGSLQNGLIWFKRRAPSHAFSGHRNCWSKQEAALLLEMASRFCSALPPYSRCSALIGLQRLDPGFRAMGLRGVFVICCNLAYMMSVHAGPPRPI